MKSFLKGLGLVFMLLCLLILFLPMMHGGNLASALFYEIKQFVVKYPQAKQSEKKQRIEKEIIKKQLKFKLSKRFAGALTVQIDSQQDSWQRGNVNEVNVWLDTNTGIIWRDFQGYTLKSWGPKELKQARNYCHRLSPVGYWSLPTNAEFALGVKSNMQAIFPDIKGRWIAQMHNSMLSMPDGMPSLIGFQNQGIKLTSVRCVGRIEMAPVHGYIRDDITNAEALGLLSR